jgi:broad specificity phosphatase PhoE
MKAAFSAILLILALVTPAAVASAQVQPLVKVDAPVFVIRHFQKGAGADPSLTAEGSANAQRLAGILKDKGIKAIFATATRRAVETAEPLAEALGIPVVRYDPSNVSSLASAVRAADGPVLIVGHSNTVPELVALFGGARPTLIGDDDYGMLFEVAPDGTVTTQQVR